MSQVIKSTRTLVMVGATVMLASHATAETWRFASKMPTDSPEGKVFQKFADEVARLTNNDLTIRIFPSEQLGKSAAVLEQLQRGTVHMYAEGSSWAKKWNKNVDFINTRYLFKNREAWAKFATSDMVQGWFKEAEAKSGVKVLGDLTAVLRGPYRVIVSKNPINDINDFKGLKIRQTGSKIAIRTYTTLGSEVRKLGWTDVYQSMKTGIVEAVISPAALVESMRFYEVAPNIGRLEEYYQSIAFFMNGKAYDGLSDAHKKALLQAHKVAAKYSVAIMGNATKESFARMKAKGVNFTNIDVAPMIKVMRPVYEKMEADGEMPKGMLKLADTINAES